MRTCWHHQARRSKWILHKLLFVLTYLKGSYVTIHTDKLISHKLNLTVGLHNDPCQRWNKLSQTDRPGKKCTDVQFLHYIHENKIKYIRDQPTADIWVLPIYRYRPKRPILSPSIGVDKTLLYSSHIQTTCARKHNEASQDSYLTTTLAGAVS